MKKLLFLSPFFFPEPISTGKYNSIVVQKLAATGVDIDVLCAHPIYPQWKVAKTEATLDGVNIIRGGSYLKFPTNVLLRRAVLEIWYFLFTSFTANFGKSKYSDAVVVFPPSLFMLLMPLILRQTKITGIVHDLQGVYAKQGSGFVKKLIFKLIKYVESVAFKSCNNLIFLSEDMMNVAKKEYRLDNVSCYVHYPFVTIDQFTNDGSLSLVIPSDTISIVYSGALGEKQAPKKLAEFLSILTALHPNIKPYIFSQGPEFEQIRRDFPSISFHSLVEEKDLPELLLRSTIQILPQESGTSDGSLPSKLPNLLASGCKILCITDPGSELVRILESYSKAVVSHSWDADILVQLAVSLLDNRTESNQDKDLEMLEKFQLDSLIKRILH